MDAELAKRAIDEAFVSQINKLFGVMCSNVTGDSKNHAAETFRRGFEIAEDCRSEALAIAGVKAV